MLLDIEVRSNGVARRMRLQSFTFMVTDTLRLMLKALPKGGVAIIIRRAA